MFRSEGPYCGAVDELWWRLFSQVFVAIDTGRITLGPIFEAHPPMHPPPFNWGWQYFLIPTDLLGEAYLVATWENWWPDPDHWQWDELIVYYIREYGAEVDSFYYAGYDGNFDNIVTRPHPVPTSFHVQVYPNPFNGTVRVQFQVERPQMLEMVVYDVLGRIVARIPARWVETGAHEWTWSPEGLASGTYYISLASERQTRAGAVRAVYVK
jgi:hypothetical protein